MDQRSGADVLDRLSAADPRALLESPWRGLRLEREERFTIIKLAPKKGVRIAQTWEKIPVSEELIETHEAIEIFRQQFGDNLYKIWPQKPLEPGEYAVIEYTEGKGNTRVWDFSWRGSTPTTP